MPLIRIDIVRGRTKGELKVLLQAIHDAMRDSFDVPDADRYQILTEHDESNLVMEDTGLGFARSRGRVMIQVTTRPRSVLAKSKFYQTVTELLGERAGVAPQDVMISCVENTDADWSFGLGRAQFLTHEL